MATRDNSRRDHASNSRRAAKWVVVAIAIYGVLFVASTPGGIVHFSPDTLESRVRSERLLFLLGLPTYRSPSAVGLDELAEFLVAQGHWTPEAVDEPRWILMNHWNSQWRDGHSNVYRELYWKRDEWMAWTENYPDMAARVWPFVLKIMRDPRIEYPDSAVATLLYFAKNAEDQASLETTVRTHPEMSVALDSRLIEQF